jgi:hypothetical protein
LGAGIQSRAGLNCSGTGSKERRLELAKGTRRGRGCLAGSLLLQTALYTEEVRTARPRKLFVSVEAIAVTIPSGPKNSRLRKRRR